MQNHQRTTVLLLALLLSVLPVAAQQRSVSGRIIDGESREALIRATIQLYKTGKKDTTFVSGTYSDQQGRFSLNNVKTGTYLLRISYLGYKQAENV